jgi:hypothetical protein
VPALAALKFRLVRFSAIFADPPGEVDLDMVNTASLVSTGLPSAASLILILHFVDAISGTFQEYAPSLEVDDVTADQLLPLLPVYSIFTLPTVPVEVHLIVYVEPAVKLSPPSGEVTVIVG